MTEMKPFSTYPEDREKLLKLSQTILDQYPSDESYKAAADDLADLVKAILTDEQAAQDAELFDEMTEAFSQEIDQGWQNYKSALPVAEVVNDNQPGKTAIVEILTDPPTLAVGTKLYATPVIVTGA
jgi:hypothetical protein